VNGVKLTGRRALVVAGAAVIVTVSRLRVCGPPKQTARSVLDQMN
jgi:hypothetical protein